MDQNTLNNTVEHLAGQLQNCDLETLCAIKPVLTDMINDIESSIGQANNSPPQERRLEERYPAEMDGILTRISDIHPGEKREFQIKIKDMSRQGMSLEIETDYIPSRINRITFIGFSGKVKEIYVQITRMHKECGPDSEWLKLGCRIVTQEQIRVVRRQEEKVQQVLNRLHRKKNINILLVGNTPNENQCLLTLIAREGFFHQQVKTVHQATTLIGRETFDLALFTEWDKICQDASLIDRLNAHADKLAKISLIKPGQNQAAFLKSGIDACLSRCDDRGLLIQALERGIIHHLSRDQNACQVLNRKAVLICNDNEAINLLSYLFQEHHFFSPIYPHIEDVNPQALANADLVFLDFDDQNIEAFRTACNYLAKFPIIGICRNMEQGHQAITNGAKDFLCLPPKDKDFQMILDNWTGAEV